MQYLILDPVESYSRRFVEFLASRDLEAVAVFTGRRALLQWQHLAARRLGGLVVGQYLLEDHEGLPELARRLERDWPHGFVGIIPWGEDHILIGAELGDLLGLEWNSLEVIERCRDKAVMKDWLRRTSPQRVNAGRVVRNAAEALAFQGQLGRWPIVVKPTRGGGSEDVHFVGSRDELLRACQAVLESGAGAVLLEELVEGTEYAVNGLADRDGDLLVTDVWRYDKRSSHGFANLYYASTKVSTNEEEFAALAHYAGEVVEALGLVRAPVHMEIKLDDRGPCLIEVAARLAGGNQPTLASLLHERSLFELAACHYLAELPLSAREVDYRRYDSRAARIVSGIQAEEIPQIHAIQGIAEVEALPSFADFGFLRPVGARLPATRDLATKSYEVYLVHDDPLQVERDARAVRRLLRYG